MKFIKADGSVEEGVPLEESTAKLREMLEEYLHIVVCKGAYHPNFEGTPRCRKASNELSLILADFDSDGRLGNVIEFTVGQLRPKPVSVIEEPEPVAEPVAVEAPVDMPF